MKRAQVSELKASLSDYLARVKRGEEVVVTERGRAIAKLIPLSPGDTPEDERLGVLEREGLVRRGEKSLPKSFWKRPAPIDRKSELLKALLDERASGR